MTTAVLESPKPQTAKPSRILLPAGVKRQIRVKRDELYANGTPYIVTGPDGKEALYREVEIMGPSRMAMASRNDPADGCYPQMSAFVETESAILVN